MEYKKMENVKLPVSRMVFGTATPKVMQGEHAFELLDAVLEAGINTFDSARIYEMAEKTLGDWMAARNNRSQINLLTKGAHPLPGSEEPRVTPQAIRADVAESLEMLQTDFIDIYLLHRDDKKQPVGPLVETLNELREEGKIGIFGGSNWTCERIDEANEYAYSHDMFGFEVSSPAYALAEQVHDPWGGGCVTISGERHRSQRRWYMEKGIEVFSYAGLAHGFLSGKFKAGDCKEAARVLDEYAVRGYCCTENVECLRRAEYMAARKNATVPQIALAWLLHQPLQPFVMCSASTPERMLHNIGAFEIHLSEADLAYLNGQNGVRQ